MAWKSQRLSGGDGKGGKEGEKFCGFFLTVLKMMVVIWVIKTREELRELDISIWILEK